MVGRFGKDCDVAGFFIVCATEACQISQSVAPLEESAMVLNNVVFGQAVIHYEGL